MRARLREVVAVAGCVAVAGGALTVAALRAGDGGGAVADRAAAIAAAVPLEPAPPVLTHACRKLASSHRVPVRCPARMPAGSARAGFDLSYPDLAPGADAYLIDGGAWTARERRVRPVPFHVIVAGTRTRYDLATTPDGRWPARFPPRADPLRLVPLGPLKPGGTETFPRHRVRTLARSGDTVVLRLPPYPAGGIHGGHVAALRTIGGASYAVSVHFDTGALPVTEQAALVAALARTL